LNGKLVGILVIIILILYPLSVIGLTNKNINFDKIIIKNQLNHPPNRPMRPYGPTKAEVNFTYRYSTYVTDPDGDPISIGWDWNGDYIVDNWIGWVRNGTYDMAHFFTKINIYKISVKAKDFNGAESEWSDPLIVIMPKTKSFDSIPQVILWLLERFPFLQTYFL